MALVDETEMHALVHCDHARQLRLAMRKEWPLLDEEQFPRLTPHNLMVLIDNVGTDMGARVLLLLWRTWQVRNNLTHDSEKLFLCRVSEIFEEVLGRAVLHPATARVQPEREECGG